MGGEDALVDAFVDGVRRGQAGGLYVEGDVLHLEGMWQAVLRLDADAYLVRAEPPLGSAEVLDRLAAVLRERGLQPIPGDHPLVQAVAYTELSLSGIAWTVWARDAGEAERALAGRALPELEGSGWAPSVRDDPALGDLSEEFARGLRDGMPTSVVLAVGLDDETVAGLAAALPDCRIEPKSLDEAIAACGVVVPHLAIVDASTDRGRRVLLELRAEACGRHIPVVALTAEEVPLGADVALDPRTSPSDWQAQLVELLP